MSTFVVDSSVAMSWCFKDEASPATDELLDRVADEGAMVPALWHLEVANVLLKAETRGRIALADVATRLELLAALPIVTDHQASTRAWREILILARAEHLTTYDACYLELAARRSMTLLTQDRALANAAHRLGVITLP